YVCDPCWAIDDCCDPCGWDPCAVCDPCAPACNPCEPVCNPCAPACEPCEPACFNTGAVFAPGGCCGNGYMPGQVRPLNKETGRPEGAKGAGAAPARSYEPEEQPAATEQPAVPGVEDDAQPVDEYNSGAPEIAPATEPATTGAGLIKMLVPKDAVVYVNGYRTKQTGEVRTFAAKNLEVGETYAFEIRVVAVRDGRTYEDVQSTTLTAGDTSSLAFNLTLRGNQAYAYNK
ncbi:MAG: TIGR03000 domain-containing protein, partial [Thermoguttaceae bacterium]|nr:TIGR03000 domain-containing protein [Thermoguttaceae bacterium]